MIKYATLKKFKRDFEKELKKSIFKMQDRTELHKAIEYSLLSGGKRLRPILVMMIAETIGKNLDVLESALSVEYFHTASLIADDFPCMDDEDFRRGKPTLHKKYPESTALLASYTLIAGGYQKIVENSKGFAKETEDENLANKACVLAFEIVSKNAGLLGATSGQFLDLLPQKKSKEMLLDIIQKKTATLFEICFSLGWIFGGGDVDQLSKIRDVSRHFGMAFQIADDIKDINQDLLNENTTNLVVLLGEKKAKEAFDQEVLKLEKRLVDLDLFKDPLKIAFEYLKNY